LNAWWLEEEKSLVAEKLIRFFEISLQNLQMKKNLK